MSAKSEPLFQVDRKVAAETIHRVVSFAKGHGGTVPILSYVRVTPAGENIVSVFATDLERAITASMPVEGLTLTEPLLLPGVSLDRFLSKLQTDHPVKILATQDRPVGQLKIQCGRARAQISVLDANDHPDLSADVTGGERFKVEWHELERALGSIFHACPEADPRYFLNGVCIELEGDRMSLVATDGHRLATSEITVAREDGEKGPVQRLVPHNAVRAIRGALTGAGSVWVSLSANGIMFGSNDAKVEARLIDGRFPEWRAAVGQRKGKALIDADVSADELLAAVSRGMAFTEGKGSRDDVTLRAAPADKALLVTVGDHYDDVVDCDDPGEGGAVGDPASGEVRCNPAYIVDAVSSRKTERVRIRHAEAGGPVIISAVGASEAEYALVMPVRK